MTYTPAYPAGWHDQPNTTTPITAAALAAIDAGLLSALFTAADGSLVVGGSAGAKTIRTGTLDQIAAAQPAAAAWSNNGKKITGLANGTAASDAATFGQTAAGGTIVPGQYLTAPHVYNPGTPANPAISATTLAAFDSANITTGVFTAPSSGSVLVTAAFQATPTAVQLIAYALAEHGTVSPVLGNVVVTEISSGTNQLYYNLQFVVTGLTPGSSHQFDLLGAAASGSVTIHATGQTSTTPTATIGAPVIMTVQAI
jgi:hypothetical protein